MKYPGWFDEYQINSEILSKILCLPKKTRLVSIIPLIFYDFSAFLAIKCPFVQLNRLTFQHSFVSQFHAQSLTNISHALNLRHPSKLLCNLPHSEHSALICGMKVVVILKTISRCSVVFFIFSLFSFLSLSSSKSQLKS